MHRLNRVIFASLLLGFPAFVAAQINSPAALVPGSLTPGDDFYVIFITSGTRDASSTNIADYNTFVNTQADLSGVFSTDDPSITWEALGATSGNDNCTAWYANAAVPVFLVNGTKVADNLADLSDGSIDAAINVTQAGATLNTSVFTGCRNDYAAHPTFVLGNAGGSIFGTSSDTTTVWIDNVPAAIASNFSFYAISPLLRVPAPVAGNSDLTDW